MSERVETRAGWSADRLDLGDGWRRTSPLGILALGLSGIRQAILPIVAILFGARSADLGPGATVGILLAIVTLNMAVTAIAWWKTQYRIGSSDIRVHKGILGRQARSVPFERIQDVSLEQGVLARLLGLAEVRFETGAGGKDELKLAFVTMAEGEALRETVRARIDPEAAVELIDPTGRPRPDGKRATGQAPLFAMGPRRLLVFGLFEFSLVIFAVLLGAAQQFDFLLSFDLWDFDAWEERLSGPGARLAGLGPAARFVGAIIAVAGLAILGLATGVARTFAREYGFLLERTAKGFRRRRGLLTRTDVVMPLHRVQAVTVSTGILRRLWGWHGLAFVSLAHDAKASSHSVAPFAQIEEFAPIADAAGYALPAPDTDWHCASPRYRLDRALVSAALPSLTATGAIVLGNPLLAVGALLIAVLIGLRQFFLWRHERHALDARRVLVRTGWLAPRLKVASRQKLHSVSIVQGPLAQLRGYADLSYGLAGGHLRFHGVPLEEAHAMRAAVLRSIVAVDFSELPQ